MSVHEISPEEQVKNLPYTIPSFQPSESPSNRVHQINVKHITRHEILLFDYANDVKQVNTNVMVNLKEICTETKDRLDKCHHNIARYFDALKEQECFSSVQQFNTIWTKIKEEVGAEFEHIVKFDSTVMETCEAMRFNGVKKVMEYYYEEIKNAGFWDSFRLANYLDNELYSSNMDLLSNYRKYASMVANMKAATLVRMKCYRRDWEKHLLGWRDFLLHKNQNFVQEMLLNDEFSDSKELKEWRCKTFERLDEQDKEVIAVYKEIIQSLPYISKKLTPFSAKISELLQCKQKIVEEYLDKATAHHNTLIKKVQQKLDDIKGFLFREASCDESQFQKSFSKFVNDGDESYEKSSQQSLKQDNIDLTRHIDLINDVDRCMIQFLYKVSETWTGNAEIIKNQRQELLQELKTLRDRHIDASRITEKDIDRRLSKVPQISSVVKLDIMLERVFKKLNRIDTKSKDLFNQMNCLIVAYPQRCWDQIYCYETSMLALIGLEKVCDEDAENITMHSNNKFVRISGQLFKRCIPGQNGGIVSPLKNSGVTQFVEQKSQDIVTELMNFASQVIVDHIKYNNINYKSTYEVLVKQLQNELLREEKVRADIHGPREENIRKQFEMRKSELCMFSNSFQNFYQCVKEFEARLMENENNYVKEADSLISSIENVVEKACKKQLLMECSQKLIVQHQKFEGSLFKMESELAEKAKVALTFIDRDSRTMKETEDEFIKYALAGHFELGQKSKYSEQLSEAQDQVKNIVISSKRNIKQIEVVKNKKLSNTIQSYKNHYKHCLLDLYFLEMRTMLLAKVKVQIKCTSSHSDIIFPKIRDLLKNAGKAISEFDCTEPKQCVTDVGTLATRFTEGFRIIKSLINFYNYRCSPISIPAKHSLEELNQNYANFSAAEPSVEHTIEFTKSILTMTSTAEKDSNSSAITMQMDGLFEETDDNWLIDVYTVERKFITGNIRCVYGVGANMLDVTSQPSPFPGPSSNASVCTNSFWLGGGELPNKRPGHPRKTTTSSRFKDLSSKVASLVPCMVTSAGGLPDISSTRNMSTSISPMPLQQNKSNLSIATLESRESGLPKLSDSSTSLGFSKRDSINQLNMAKLLNLNKTVDIICKKTDGSYQRRKTSCFNQQNPMPIYDFITMTEDEIKPFVFEPMTFFNLPIRKYDVNKMCENIVSITEKVKFYLLHLQEDFIVACLIFYRQKHLSIKFRQKMKLNHEAEIQDFKLQLKKNLETIYKQCELNIQKVKSLLSSTYKMFISAPVTIFGRIFVKYKTDFSQFFNVRMKAYDEKLKLKKDSQHRLHNSLNPQLAHPEHEPMLKSICAEEEELYACKDLSTFHHDCLKMFAKILKEFELCIQRCCTALIKTAENAIQIEDIRKMTKYEENTFEVQKRLRHNLAVTTSQPPSFRRGSAQVGLVNYQQINGTITKLIGAVLSERDKYLLLFADLQSSRTKQFIDYHARSEKELESWHEMWLKSVQQINALRNNPC